MRAGFIEKPSVAMFRDDMPEPQLTEDNQVKIQVKTTGICGSEVHAYHGRHAWRVPPLVSGHEFAGVVAAVGRNVTQYKVGDRVTAEPQYGCGHCELCQAGHYNLCKDKKILGATYWSGSFGEYVVVPEQCVIPLADTVSFEQGALIEPLAVGMHAVRTHKVSRQHSIAVIGCSLPSASNRRRDSRSIWQRPKLRRCVADASGAAGAGAASAGGRACSRRSTLFTRASSSRGSKGLAM